MVSGKASKLHARRALHASTPGLATHPCHAPMPCTHAMHAAIVTAIITAEGNRNYLYDILYNTEFCSADNASFIVERCNQAELEVACAPRVNSRGRTQGSTDRNSASPARQQQRTAQHQEPQEQQSPAAGAVRNGSGNRIVRVSLCHTLLATPSTIPPSNRSHLSSSTATAASSWTSDRSTCTRRRRVQAHMARPRILHHRAAYIPRPSLHAAAASLPKAHHTAAEGGCRLRRGAAAPRQARCSPLAQGAACSGCCCHPFFCPIP